jgi:hypothetical protein
MKTKKYQVQQFGSLEVAEAWINEQAEQGYELHTIIHPPNQGPSRVTVALVHTQAA